MKGGGGGGGRAGGGGGGGGEFTRGAKFSCVEAKIFFPLRGKDSLVEESRKRGYKPHGTN